jgi:hypothetical protein
MAESFVKTIKRYYVVPTSETDQETALHDLAIVLEDYNEQHPHIAPFQAEIQGVSLIRLLAGFGAPRAL